MSYDSLHDRFRGGAIIPNRHVAFVVSDSNGLPPNVCEIVMNITAAGNVVFQMDDGTQVTYAYPTAGLIKEIGQFNKVLNTGTTVTLSPASTVIAKYIA